MTNLALKNENIISNIPNVSNIYSDEMNKITLTSVIDSSHLNATPYDVISLIQSIADSEMEIEDVIKLVQKKKEAADRAEKRLKKLERAEEITVPVRPLTYDEWKTLALYLKEKSDTQYVKYKKVPYLYFMLQCAFGRRASDMTCLKVKDVMVNKTTPKARLIVVEKKTTKYISLEINDVIAHLLKEHFAMQDNFDLEDWLFPTAYHPDKHYTVPSARTMLQRAAFKCGLSVKVASDGKENDFDRSIGNIGTHSLRKYFATLAYENSGDIVLISKMLNHSDIQTTEAYIGLTQKKQDELMRQTSTQMCIG